MPREGILIDPTHDFGKNTFHGLALLRRCDELVATGWPVLMALSNKDFVGETLGVTEVTDRLEGTLAATALAAAAGARVFRAHEVAATRRTVDMVASIVGHPGSGPHGARVGLSPRKRPTRGDARGGRHRALVRPPHLAGAAAGRSRSWSRPRRGRRVSVVLPALDEEATVGAIVAAIVPLTSAGPRWSTSSWSSTPGSTDRTVEVAAAAGARVVRAPTSCPSWTPWPGKGEVLWRSLAATTGDVLCYLDSDLVDFDPAFVPALLGPLLVERRACTWSRASTGGRCGWRPSEADTGGGRVTELLVRPLLAALRPELAGRGAAAGRRVRGHPGAAGVAAVRGGLRGGDRPAARHARRAVGSTRSPRSTSACASTATGRCCSWG